MQKLFYTFFGLTSALLQANAAPLSFEAYLNQVRTDSPGLKASQESSVGALSSSRDKDLPFMPKFFAQISQTYDERQFAVAFLGGKTRRTESSFGFEKQFDFGLTSKLSYNLLTNNTSNLPTTIFPTGANIYTTAQTQLDLTQSLWKNFLGKETRANETLAEASSLNAHYLERFKLKQLIAKAEGAYYRLAIANESVKLEKELLDGSKKILNWTEKRVKNQLTDKIDFLQAKASYQNRLISLQSAEDEARAARIEFNLLRNLPSAEVNEEVTLLNHTSLLNMQAPERAAESDDLLAAKQTERIAVANQEIGLQRTLPDVSLFGTAAFNGVDYYSNPAIKRSLTTDNPLYIVGVKLSVPLYFMETSEIRSGRVKQQLAAELATRQKTLEFEQTWADLSAKLKESKDRLRLADELVSLQKEKLEYEKYRFNLGRTTTYQVLMFEQDYAQALISKLRIEKELLATHSQLKTYAKD